MLWALNSLLIVILGFMIKNWVNGVSKKLDCKQDKSVCQERYPTLKKDSENFYRHKHTMNCDKDETGGVIIP